MKELFQNLTNVCLSGGADGADLQWGMCAGKAGHNVIHWSFNGHRSRAPDAELVRLDDEQLALADLPVKRAAKALSKYPPRNSWAANLIRRNYYQVAWADSVYAIASIKDNVVQGGTGWAVAMFIDLHPHNLNCFVYDQIVNSWFQWNGSIWCKIDSPPKPSGVWAGIGSRELTIAGKNNIRELLEYQIVAPT